MIQISEDILIKALEMHDQGKSLEQIYASFPPETAGELKHYFALTEHLRTEAQKIVPSRELLKSALRRAVVEREQAATAAAGEPVPTGFFDRLPRTLRLFAPALAVAVILVLADRLQVVAPSAPTPPQGVALSGSQSISEAPGPSQGSPTAQPAAAPMHPQAFSATAPAPAPSSPSAAADQVSNAFLDSADAEQNDLSDTSAAQQAAQANDSQSAQDVASPTN